MIPWDDFRLVKAIADQRSLAGAAQTLGLNHSTVFRRLGDLEKRLAMTLFERHRSGYALTPAGEEMVALAQRMDEDVVAFERRLARQELEPSGELRVTTSDTLFLHLLMPILAGFRQAYPAIRLDIVQANQALNLSKRDADIAIRATDNPPETLVGRRIATIAWAVYGRRADHGQATSGDMAGGEIAGGDMAGGDMAGGEGTAGKTARGAAGNGEAVDSSRLQERSWVSLGDSFSHLHAARYVRERAGPEGIAIRINGVLGLAEAVECGLGIGPLPCFIADIRPALMRLLPLQAAFSGGLWLLTHPDLRASPRVRAFLDYAAGAITRQRPLLEGERPYRAGPPDP
jgi:DNA-binding transcriptional LysR family regulator